MNIDEIQGKYMTALSAVTADGGWVEWAAVRLALRLAIGDAYAAGGALADDLAAIVASQAQAKPEQRAAESAINQIGRLNEWLEVNAPALYHNPDLDTAAAVLAELGVRDRRMIEQSAAIADLRFSLKDVNEDAASARQELTKLIAERDGLRQQLTQMDADKARMIAHLTTADATIDTLHQAITERQHEIDRLTRLNVIATDTFNSLAERTNGAGPNPTTAPGWNHSHPAWEGMTDAEREAVYALTKSKARFGELSMELRSEILRRVLSYTITGSEQRLTMARFDQCKPEWMPQASGLVKYFGGSWSKLLNLDLTPA